MQIQGQHEFAAPQQAVWEALLDPEVLAGTLPGFQKLERVGDNEFVGTLGLGIGPVQGRFEGHVQLHDLQEPDSYSLRLDGRGTPGYVEGQGEIHLTGQGENTLLSYDLQVQVGGRIAGLGQRLLEMTARTMTKQALKSLERQIAARL